MTTTTFGLGVLRFGHDHPSNLNPRTTGRTDKVAELAASIKAFGILIPPLVVRDAGETWVADGNRKLAALHMLREAGDVPADLPVECTVFDGSPADAFAAAYASNTSREGMHVVDLYEGVARMKADGRDESDVAKAFSLSVAAVRRLAALGAIAPPIREAWRAGTISEDVAKAFTVQPDHERQVAVFEACSASGNIHYRRNVLAELVGSPADQLLKVVTAAAYKKAGGKVMGDLFGNDTFVSDVPLLRQMARAKAMKDQGDALLADGWAWVGTDWDDPPVSEHVSRRYQWVEIRPEPVLSDSERDLLPAIEARIDDPKTYWSATQEKKALLETASRRGMTAEQKARSGCWLSVNAEGLVYTSSWGQIRPEDEVESDRAPAPTSGPSSSKSSSSGPDPVKGVGSEPQAVVDALREGQTRALALALEADPRAALVALAAALMSDPTSGSPVVVRSYGPGRELDRSNPFVDKVAEFSEQFSSLNHVVARAVAAAVDVRTRARRSDVHDGRSVSRAGVNAVAGLLTDPRDYVRRLRETWDPVAYFDGAKKDHALEAIADAISDAQAQAMKGKKKGEIAAYAIEHVPPTGWLPAEILPDGWDWRDVAEGAE